MFLYSTDNKLMEQAGLSSYSPESLETYLEAAKTGSNSIEIITKRGSNFNSPDYIEELSVELLGVSGQIYTWNNDLKKYTIKNIDNIQSKCEDYRNYIRSINLPKSKKPPNFPDLERSVKEVTNSRDGYIEFKSKLTFYASRVPNDLKQDIEPLIKLKFKNPDFDTDIPTIDSIAITDVPETRGGSLYSRYSTDVMGSGDGPASIRKMINYDQNDLRNKAAGFLDTNYNKNTGRFECGNRCVVARLLKDVLGVSYESLPDDVDNLRYDDFYSENASHNQIYTWNPEENTSEALVLYVHGNENIFGPLFMRGFDSTDRNSVDFDKKEKINIVNRTPTSFTKGEVVLAFYIDGEWLPVKLPVGNSGPPALKISKWSFNKIMVNSYSYFRDARWKDYKINGSGPDYIQDKLSPSTYLQKVRNKFYLSSSGDIKGINLFPYKKPSEITPDMLSIELSKRDIQTGSFIQSDIRDQLSPKYGGHSYSDKVYINSTNIYHLDDDESKRSDYDMLGFWGPVFTDGFNLQDINNTGLDSSGDNIAKPPSVISDNHFFTQYHIPAELGNNAPLNHIGIGSPFENLKVSLSWIDEDDIQNAVRSLQSNVSRFNYIPNSSNSNGEPLYALKPENPKKISFVPLTAETVVSTYTFDNNGDNLPTLVRWVGSLDFEPDGNEEKRPDTGIKQNFHDFLASGVKYFPTNYIPFWRYIDPKLRSSGKSGGLPFTWGSVSDNGEVIGVISSKCKIKIGGQNHRLRINLDQYFGVSSKLTVTAGQGPVFSAIGSIMFGDNGTGPRTNVIATWGREFDSLSEANITALYMRIYDAWPQEQTIVDPRYFTVFHFNPGVLGTESGESSVDFRVPTGSGSNGAKLSYDTTTPIPIANINLDINTWKKEYIRRGQLLSLGGFRYYENYLVVKTVEFASNTDREVPDGEYSSSGLIVKKTSNQLEIIEGGKNLLNNGVLTLSGTASTINVKITHYIVDHELKHDLGPQERIPITLLTDKSNGGNPINGDPPGVVSQPKTHLIEIPTINPKGEYDIFFHFFNDITHTLYSADVGISSKQQHVSIEIGTE
jgi:hypothetical protein